MRQESAYDCASFYCDKGRRMVGGGQEQKMTLEHAVFLDGDWCWDAQPFVVNEETKAMVIRNICFLLNNFLHCSAYENIIFCWVMHEQEIIDSIVENLDMENCQLKCISLRAGEQSLRDRLQKDVRQGLREADVIHRSIERIPLYQNLNTIKVETDGKSVQKIVDEIRLL